MRVKACTETEGHVINCGQAGVQYKQVGGGGGTSISLLPGVDFFRRPCFTQPCRTVIKFPIWGKSSQSIDQAISQSTDQVIPNQ